MHRSSSDNLSWQSNPLLLRSASRRCQNGASYITEGNGPPVVMIHGIGASLYDWASLSPTLAQNGYAAYALDLLGDPQGRTALTILTGCMNICATGWIACS